MLNLNLHFHALFIDGVYRQKNNGKLRFHRVNTPTASELNTLVATISQRVARHLVRQGLLAADDENSYLTMDWQDNDAMNQLQGHSMMRMEARMPRSIWMCESGHLSHCSGSSAGPQSLHLANDPILGR